MRLAFYQMFLYPSTLLLPRAMKIVVENLVRRKSAKSLLRIDVKTKLSQMYISMSAKNLFGAPRPAHFCADETENNL